MSKCRIDNKYYKSTMYTNTIYYAATGAYVNAPVSHFRIIAPKASEKYRFVKRFPFLLKNYKKPFLLFVFDNSRKFFCAKIYPTVCEIFFKDFAFFLFFFDHAKLLM